MVDAERKLAAVLSADVVEYSRLMAEDDVGTVQRITEYRELIGVRVREQRGRVVDSPGDNLLAEFPSALDATRCAVEIQRVLKTRNADLPAQRRMEFRIGVHLGDVMVEGERIYGDGVNIAARLEALADAGGICVSGEVHGQVRHRLRVEYEDLGEQEVKNIPDPVHVFRVREASLIEVQPSIRRPAARWAAEAAVVIAAIAVAVGIYVWTQPSPPAGPPLTAIAVLPFDDMSPGGDQEWLANGMAEELIESLSRIAELKVIARSSTSAMKGKDARSVGEQLGVGALVEGSVRRADDQLRITAQLIRTADGSHLWSGRYDRALDDVLAVQQEIAREIAEAVRTELGIADWSVLRGGRYTTPDVRAWELVRKAQDVGFATMTEEGLREARGYYVRALEIDSGYAVAHGSIAWVDYLLWVYGLEPSEKRLSMAKAAAERALEFDDSEALAHELLADFDSRDGDWEGAVLRLEHALRARPEHAGLHAKYAEILAEIGRLDEALSEIRRAITLDPGHSIRHASLGWICEVARDYDCAIEAHQTALELMPTTAFAAFSLARVWHQKGRDEEALAVCLRYPAGFPLGMLPAPELEARLQRGFDEDGWTGLNRALANGLATRAGNSCGEVPGVGAHLYAQSGQIGLLYQCLDEHAAERRISLWLMHSPTWDPYRDDPRFQAVLRRMGLEE